MGNGAGSGDSLRLEGYGADAFLTNSGDDWTVVYNDGAGTETFEIANVTSLSAGDYLFV